MQVLPWRSSFRICETGGCDGGSWRQTEMEGGRKGEGGKDRDLSTPLEEPVREVILDDSVQGESDVEGFEGA
jgi:hypothetical protein